MEKNKFLECKFFTNTDDIIEPELFDFCKTVSQIENLAFTGSSLAVIDINLVDTLLETWNKNMCPIIPFYAMKALPDDKIIEKMTYFDCASSTEFKQVLKLGRLPENIIFANTAKRLGDILEAKKYGIELMTVDSIYEVEKILYIYPECGIVLRIATSDEGASFTTFAHKFGSVSYEKSIKIIDLCYKNLKGFSFHVGCGQTNVNAWSNAMIIVDELYNYIKLKYPEIYNQVNIIDIGGGFSSDKKALQLVDIRRSLNTWLIKYEDKKWIAECGRYFCADVMTLLCPIISKNFRNNDRQYYVIGNSIHHTFSCIIFDLHKPRELTKDDFDDDLKLCDATMVGETCDGIDILYHGILPYDLPIGTILIFQGIGAYSNASSNNFNGFNCPQTIYYDSNNYID